MNFISTFDELNKLYENASSKALHEGYTVKYGRGGKGVDFDSLEDAVQHINDGMQKRSQTSYVLYQDGKELIWLDWYTANRDGSDSNWSESRKAAKAPVSFDKKEGKLSVIEDALTEGDDYWRDRPYYGQSQKDDKGVIKPYQKPADYKGSQTEWERKVRDSQDTNRSLRRNPWEALDKEAEDNALLAEAAEEPTAEDEPRQVICECDKCGALVIKDEADIVVDEETDLVNVEDECQFCEEAKGFKIIGVVAPYTADEEVEVDDDAEEALEEVDEPVAEALKEGFIDKIRKALDLPAPVIVQQFWEAMLNDEFGEISPELRKEIENKFLQQRDWEARHQKNESVDEDADKEELEELLDFSVPVSVTANGNDVTVGGIGG